MKSQSKTFCFKIWFSGIFFYLLQGCSIEMDEKPTGTVLSNKTLEHLNASTDEICSIQNHQPSCNTPVALPCSHPSRYLDELSSCGVSTLSQKLRNLEMQTRMTLNRSSLDPSCLLTPPKSPVNLISHKEWAKTNDEALPWSSAVDVQDEGGLVFECLAALKVDPEKSDSNSLRRLVEVNEQQEEEEKVLDDYFDQENDKVFSLELERDLNGLGLALADTKEISLKGIVIRALVPDSPAARCEKLLPGDRILAVNGVSLLGLDYRSGEDLIQLSGTKLRLLVARSKWMVKAICTEC